MGLSPYLGIAARAVAVTAALLLLVLAAPPRSAASSQEEQRGAELLVAVERGERECVDLDKDEFAAIGEFAMGRMLDSEARHERMDVLISDMMGADRLDAMHEAMGRRFADCGGGDLPPWSGSMMGGFGMMGGFDPADLDAEGRFGPGAYADRDGDGDAWIAAAVLLVVVLAGAAAAFLLVRSTRRPATVGQHDALELLRRRCARGEISVEEYRERRALLEGDR